MGTIYAVFICAVMNGQVGECRNFYPDLIFNSLEQCESTRILAAENWGHLPPERAKNPNATWAVSVDGSARQKAVCMKRPASLWEPVDP